jgi:predicted O-methyltransferase YrrM
MLSSCDCYQDAYALVDACDGLSAPTPSHATLVDEYERVESLINNRGESVLPYPRDWAIEGDSGRLLYAMVRRHKPNHVVETGVANGLSTSIILKALEANGNGVLTSLDISRDVGALVDREADGRWNLVVLDKRSVKRSFHSTIASLPPIDIFIHDSWHGYQWQTLEYGAAWSHLRPGGLLGSDDIELSYAFLDFSQRVARHRPLVLLDSRKAFGVVRRT